MSLPRISSATRLPPVALLLLVLFLLGSGPALASGPGDSTVEPAWASGAGGSAAEPPATTRGFRIDADSLGVPPLIGLRQQEGAEGEPAGAAQDEEAIRVFLDCTGRGGRFRGGPCRDQEFLRRQITFINYVRDRQDADVHVLVTSQEAGATTEYTLAFIGQGQFEGDDVTHVYNASETNTDDETRRGFADVLRVGLLHYVVQTPLFSELNLDVARAEAVAGQQVAMATPEEDPWNFWVFFVSVRGEFEEEDRQSRRNANLFFSANRTTREWKIRLGSNFRYDERTFTLNDGQEVLSFTRNYSITHQTVKSLGEHWGASIRTEARHATFRNQDLTLVVAPGIEYNIFPYDESSRRQFTFTYEIGAGYYQYEELTIFQETEEFLPDHLFLVNYDVNQPWGEANFGVELGQFLSDFDQWRAVFDGRLDFRVTRGLSININGEYSSIRDQRFLPAEELSDEEVLLERQQLQTDSRYQISFGVTYRFGSIFNNVVNSRFSSNRGGFGGGFF